MELINFAAHSDQGPYLNINEDLFDFDFENDLYMVLDGFGGNGRGDVCVSELIKNLKQFYGNFVIDRDSTLPFFYSPRYLAEGNALINAALNSHAKLYEKNLGLPLEQRAGASGILISKVESVVTILSIGNCRAYLSRKAEIIPIFTDDSFKFLSHDYYDSFLKCIPMSGFGLFPDLHYQVREVRIAEGDRLILLTQGVFARVNDDELNSCILKPTMSIKNKIEELFTLANARGNLSNQTGMILEF